MKYPCSFTKPTSSCINTVITVISGTIPFLGRSPKKMTENRRSSESSLQLRQWTSFSRLRRHGSHLAHHILMCLLKLPGFDWWLGYTAIQTLMLGLLHTSGWWSSSTSNIKSDDWILQTVVNITYPSWGKGIASTQKCRLKRGIC